MNANRNLKSLDKNLRLQTESMDLEDIIKMSLLLWHGLFQKISLEK